MAGFVRFWTPPTSLYTTKIAMTTTHLSELFSYSVKNPFSSAFNGDWSAWVSNIMWYPIQMSTDQPSNSLKIYTDSNTGCHAIGAVGDTSVVDRYNFTPYLMGANLKIDPTTWNATDDYTKYSPYTKWVIYLPYYGNVSVDLSQYYGMYLQIYLDVNVYTGLATYIIALTAEEFTSTNSLFAYGDNQEAEFTSAIALTLAEYTFQLGMPIAIGDSGDAQRQKNILGSISNFAFNNIVPAVMGNVAQVATSGATTFGNIINGQMVSPSVGAVGGGSSVSARNTTEPLVTITVYTQKVSKIPRVSAGYPVMQYATSVPVTVGYYKWSQINVVSGVITADNKFNDWEMQELESIFKEGYTIN